PGGTVPGPPTGPGGPTGPGAPGDLGGPGDDGDDGADGGGREVPAGSGGRAGPAGNGSGWRISPLPRIQAMPPVTQNGTSEPSEAARVARATGSWPSPRRRAPPTSVPAASADPPPRPAPAGIDLWSEMSRPDAAHGPGSSSSAAASSRSRAARAARFVSSAGTPTTARPDSRTRTPNGGWIRRPTTSCGSRSETTSASRSWYPSGRRPSTRNDSVSLARASTRTSRVIRPPRPGRPAAASTSSARSPSAGRSAWRSVLRRWANPARASPNRASGEGTSTGGAARRSKRTTAESTFGRGTNTVGGTVPTTAAVAW